jgi:hypothetical protein
MKGVNSIGIHCICPRMDGLIIILTQFFNSNGEAEPSARRISSTLGIFKFPEKCGCSFLYD